MSGMFQTQAFWKSVVKVAETVREPAWILEGVCASEAAAALNFLAGLHRLLRPGVAALSCRIACIGDLVSAAALPLSTCMT